MLVFSTSDKGGTGRSVTSCNIAYRLCLAGDNVAYVDFDFGSPTAGALFEIGGMERGIPETTGSGVHSYLLGASGTATHIDVGKDTERPELKGIGPRSGRLVLVPGNEGGAEFLECTSTTVTRCAKLLLALEQEFAVVVVDLSAGRSAALELALRTTALPQMRHLTVRWLIFHRWTRQHILAASGLVYGPNGLLQSGVSYQHVESELLGSLRYVRTAVPATTAESSDPHGAQSTWLQQQSAKLRTMAAEHRLGQSLVLGETPIEPVLQWREQLILDRDVHARIARTETVQAYSRIARRLIDNATWELL
ncbi:SCO2523 family variant P-loop protein [Nocardia sp. NPDC005366]|uniref:SCO2523 family variant P-loop protein n=1 Tax=Nocardia sp. NPDC005366 TaxID=3156878 RepID=UPI0033A2A8D6